MEMHGSIKLEIKDEATIKDDYLMGTGSYLLRMQLSRLSPNFIPMHGLKVKASYLGVMKECSNCFGYYRHKCEEAKVLLDK